MSTASTTPEGAKPEQARAHIKTGRNLPAAIGVGVVLGGLALLAPRAPRLKEWAYAGLFFDFTAAAASYIAIGEGNARSRI